jgi:hypothetical protein
MERRRKKKERTRLHNDGREIDFRDEQHTHAHKHRPSKKNICYREGEHAHIHARAFVRSALFLSEQRATSERREERKKKKTRSSNSNEGKQPSKRTLSLYFVLDEKIEQQG